MKEYPIIFTAESICAILAGNKTETRRIVKPQPDHEGVKSANDGFWNKKFINGFQWTNKDDDDDFHLIEHSPYGKSSDHLWVRETWNLAIKVGESIRSEHIPHYRADGVMLPRWKSPILMPRKFSRIVLEVIEVHAEQLQNIKALDVLAEGVKSERHAPLDYGALTPCDEVRAWYAFSDGWDKLNAKRGFSFESNPWVWVIKFRKI